MSRLCAKFSFSHKSLSEHIKKRFTKEVGVVAPFVVAATVVLDYLEFFRALLLAVSA